MRNEGTVSQAQFVEVTSRHFCGETFITARKIKCADCTSASVCLSTLLKGMLWQKKKTNFAIKSKHNWCAK